MAHYLPLPQLIVEGCLDLSRQKIGQIVRATEELEEEMSNIRHLHVDPSQLGFQAVERVARFLARTTDLESLSFSLPPRIGIPREDYDLGETRKAMASPVVEQLLQAAASNPSNLHLFRSLACLDGIRVDLNPQGSFARFMHKFALGDMEESPRFTVLCEESVVLEWAVNFVRHTRFAAFSNLTARTYGDFEELGAMAIKLVRETRSLKAIEFPCYPVDASVLLQAVIDNESVTRVRFQNCYFSRGADARETASNKTLKSLYFQNCDFSPGWDYLLGQCNGLASVSLVGYGFCGLRPDTLLDTLFENHLHTISELSFESHYTYDSDWLRGLPRFVRDSSSLCKLSLLRTWLPDDLFRDVSNAILFKKDWTKLAICVEDRDSVHTERALFLLQGLVQMKRLEYFGVSGMVDVGLEDAILTLVKKLPRLVTVDFELDDMIFSSVPEEREEKERHYACQMEFFAQLNRNGRLLVNQTNVPTALWPLVLALNNDKASNLFCLLREVPRIAKGVGVQSQRSREG